MKKINRTYIMGAVCLALSAFIAWQTTTIPERLVSNEPGPKMFPFISAGGIAVFAILSMIFDAPKEAKEDPKSYLDKAGWVRMGIIMAEAVLFTIGMEFIGFLITAMAGTFVFLWTLKGEKKVNLIVAILFSVGLASLGYFGFTRGFVIPLPKGVLWESLGIPMP